MARSALALLALLALAACKRGETQESPAPAPAPAAASVKPVDHLAPGELVESDQKAFGLVLPRAMRVDRRLMGRVIGSSASSPEDLSNFFRARVGGGKILVGTTTTQFLRVRAVADPSRELDIRVEASRADTQIDIVDVTAPPTLVPTSSAEARKQVGLAPDGKLLDPRHLE